MPKLNKPRLLAAVGLVALTTLLFIALPADAGDDSEHGWTVWQGGNKQTFRFKDAWKGSPHQAGFTMRNTKSGVEHIFYGTFRVEFRPRDQ